MTFATGTEPDGRAGLAKEGRGMWFATLGGAGRRPRRLWGFRRDRRRVRPQCEGLERREVLSAPAAPAVAVGRVSTTDSQSVTVSYDVTTAAASQSPPVFSVFRSADASLDTGDLPVAMASSAVDDAGHPAGAPGAHTVTLPINGGLPPDPERPYVIVSADPAGAVDGTDPGGSASFRTYVIGVVTHGGIENTSWKNGPVWELVMARSLLDEGYDAVIPYNWVAQSSTPGDAVKQIPKLTAKVLQTAAQFPADAPVDLHFIGHSEGTVINSQTVLKLETEMPANLKAGYLEMTLLDPHAANDDAQGQQFSTADNPIGWIASGILSAYQAKARDPLVVVPPGVDAAQVFFQQTPASRDHGVNAHIYNLWGQVPVRGQASYFDLTADGATHSGKTGVAAWYQRNVVPSLGYGGAIVSASELGGAIDPAEGVVATSGPDRGGFVTADSRPTYTGRAAPGSTVRLLAGRAGDPNAMTLVGRAVAGADGRWSMTPRALRDGRYRTFLVAMPPRNVPRLSAVPEAPLGLLVVDAAARRS